MPTWYEYEFATQISSPGWELQLTPHNTLIVKPGLWRGCRLLANSKLHFANYLDEPELRRGQAYGIAGKPQALHVQWAISAT